MLAPPKKIAIPADLACYKDPSQHPCFINADSSEQPGPECRQDYYIFVWTVMSGRDSKQFYGYIKWRE